ncbi:MAG: biotin transporter BioY [Sphaerochaetaceae bacterium]|nr:biotin transporter BioY [Spirochaetales bacterium]MDY5499533.1 biotin transporter BioY [Sphaerochaetaceae bacterium]
MNTLRKLLVIALFCALMIVGAFVRFPLPPVPISLQTFFVMLASLVLPPAMATESIALYLLLGAVGVPVFSSGGGIGALVGPTGGFLVGMLFEALVGSLIADHKGTSGLWRDLVALLVGEIVVYAIGIPYLKARLSLTWAKAFAVGMTPFLIGDTIKIIAALSLRRPLRDRVKAFLDKESE